MADDRWFQRHGSATDPELRLVCFPHAGGASSFFRTWPHHLPDGMELLATCYPGRQGRFAEPHATSMDDLADSITDALSSFVDTPLALFGHSMGAYVAYEVALRLTAKYDVRPLKLFVSGSAAPQLNEPSGLDLADSDALVTSVRAMGSVSGQVIDNPELLEMVLPALRADFRLTEGYRPSPPSKVRSPIVAYVGDQDLDCDLDAVRAWSQVSAARFELRVFPGDHFYLEQREPELLRHLVGHLRDDLRLHQVLRASAARQRASGGRDA
ncbi:thioesterase [Solihabitans fulvus]|uniref:Thioesterase n=1 Tax=Solihabitans fulvus TaxID=1892852 RepID=A0A5B2X315_9PSEU|nr:alpha/beta fold hydrolase [Solihabitans fulvus]KAA2257570.1 thioesterase [Solihabitans fulvus]